MKNVEGLKVVEPAEVVLADSEGDPVGAEASIFLKDEVGMGGIVEFVGAVGTG